MAAMAESLWRTPPGRLAPPHVYCMAGALGAELRRLSGRFGPDAVAGLVPPVVRLLELLEALVAPEGEAPVPAGGRQEAEGPEQRLWEAERREHALRSRLSRLEEQNQQLLGQLAESQSQEDNTARKEREVMLRLKEVVDKQRDELRAQAHEIVCKSRDTEALQEQLHRFMAMNEELRHKVAVVQAQLKSTLEKKSDLEAAMLQTQREMSRRSRNASEIQQPKPSLEEAPSHTEEPQHQDAGRSPAHCCFSKEELQQILQERNELKTNLFLVQEELAYYQRELLNEERVPSFFLDAMKSTIKRQRKKIRAKMLGTTEESESSDEDEGSWLPARGTDCVDAHPPESKIRSFFGLWYQGSSKDPPTSSSSGAWEVIDSLDTRLELEESSDPAASSPDTATPPL
ncbi:rab-interacting lysosomal protein isoform X2 [Strigops habroptila]|uniref:Rab interacting lysosomal protein n=1 Tax=Strigops habroptila TaxID=2489341 RepID=A0A672TZN8_STRHB|nr:rab-interacting lysosomal protein isoform X2 [Strigops habroptila]